MKSAEEWKVERWEGQDFIVTGFGVQHPGVLTQREAEQIVWYLKLATPVVQLDSWKQGMTDAFDISNSQADLPENEIPNHSIFRIPEYTIGIRRGNVNSANAIIKARDAKTKL